MYRHVSISHSSVLFINNPSLTQSSPVHYIGWVWFLCWAELSLASRFFSLYFSLSASVFSVSRLRGCVREREREKWENQRERTVFGVVLDDAIYWWGSWFSHCAVSNSLGAGREPLLLRFSRVMTERSPAVNWIPPCINWIGGRGEALCCFPAAPGRISAPSFHETSNLLRFSFYFNSFSSDPTCFFLRFSSPTSIRGNRNFCHRS